MWPCKNPGEDARLYKAVEACSRFACELGINIPTGKDSLSMTQKYGDEKVYSPGTVIISAGAEVSDVKKVVSPVLVRDAEYFASAFNAIQQLISEGLILAGHDISAGGMITALLEMNFANTEGGLEVKLDKLPEKDLIKILFSENPGVLIQVKDRKAVEKILEEAGVGYAVVGHPCSERHILVSKDGAEYLFGIDHLRDVWFSSSYLLDRKQSGEAQAKARFLNYKEQPLHYHFGKSFTGKMEQYGISADRRKPSGIKAAIIREKGVVKWPIRFTLPVSM